MAPDVRRSNPPPLRGLSLHVVPAIGAACGLAFFCAIWLPTAAEAAGVAPAALEMTVRAVPGKPRPLFLLAGDGETPGDRLACHFTPPSNGTLQCRFPAQFPTNSREVVYVANADFTGTDSFTFWAEDGTLTSAVATCAVVMVSNVPPRAGAMFVSAAEGIPAEIRLRASQANADPADLAVSIVEPPQQGVLDPLGPPLTFAYTATNSATADRFTYRVSDDALQSGVATCTVQVAANAAPTAHNATLRAVAGATNEMTLPVTDTYPPTDRLRCTIRAAPQHGAVAWVCPETYPTNSYHILYAAEAGFAGTDVFEFAASDGLLETAATCTVVVVTNSVPVASGGAWTVAAGCPAALPLSAWDPDMYAGTRMDLLITVPPTHGDVTQGAGSAAGTENGTKLQSFVYTPAADFRGTDTLVFVASDGLAVSGAATCKLAVVANTRPSTFGTGNQGSGVSADTIQNTPVSIYLSASDAHTPSASLLFRVVTPPAHGWVEPADATNYPANSGSVRYSPDQDFTGTDTFTYAASDWDLESEAATCTVRVALNNTPVASNMTLGTVQGLALDFELGVFDSVTPAPSLECVIVSNAAHGLVEYQNPLSYPDGSYAVRYTPDPAFAGADRFLFRCTDGQAWSGTATCLVTVATNTLPSALNQWIHAYPGQTAAECRVWCWDPDGQTISYLLESLPAHGTLTTNAFASQGVFSYVPEADYTGPDEFTWRAADGVTTTPPATCRILVHDPSSRTNQTVLLVVETNLFPNLSNEVIRLASDLDREGWTPKLRLWKGTGVTTPSNLWQYLHDQYSDPGQYVAGAVLIGDLPKPTMYTDTEFGWVYNDLVYWNMVYCQTNREAAAPPMQLWATRIIWPGGTYGSEVTLLKRALDANHDYRTGASRLPHKAFYYMIPEWWSYFGSSSVPRLAEVWPEAEGRATDEYHLKFLPARTDMWVGGADCLAAGGEVFDETSHGDASGFMARQGWFSINDLYRVGDQVRHNVIASCTTGAFGGIANHMLCTRGGGCVMAVSGTTINWEGDFTICDASENDAAFRRLLTAGECFGNAALQHFAFDSLYDDRTVFYGDLSFRAMAAPSNALPVIRSFGATSIATQAPYQVSLSLDAFDPDGTVSNIEWFMNGYNFGMNPPTHAGLLTNVDWTFTNAGVYTVRVEAMDEYKAREWREMTLTLNTAPLARDDAAAVQAGDAIVLSVLTNDLDADGQTITLDAITLQPTQGTAAIIGTSILYTATNRCWSGVDRFAYRIRDTLSGTATATVFVAVGADVKAPELAAASGGAASNTVTAIFDEPVDPATASDPARYRISDGVVVGGAALQADGRTVKLSTSRLYENIDYELAAEGVLDTSVAHNPSRSYRLFRYVAASNGVDYAYYEGAWSSLPDFDSLTPVLTGTTNLFSIAPRLVNDNFGFRFRAQLRTDRKGLYTFYTASDDGSRLYVDGAMVVDNDYTHALRERSGSVNLSFGVHPLTVTMFDATGDQALSVSWEGPGIAKQPIPPEVLHRWPTAPAPADADGDGLPDNWEIVHFGGTNAADGSLESDADHDGFCDRFELLAGTDPNDAQSSLVVSNALSGTNGGVVLSWPSVAGRLYDVRGGRDLAVGLVDVLASNLPATPPINTWPLPDVGTNGFFRVLLAP